MVIRSSRWQKSSRDGIEMKSKAMSKCVGQVEGIGARSGQRDRARGSEARRSVAGVTPRSRG